MLNFDPQPVVDASAAVGVVLAVAVLVVIVDDVAAAAAAVAFHAVFGDVRRFV